MTEEKIENINKILRAFEEHVARQQAGVQEFRNKISIITKYKDREPPFTEEESKTILSMTCYGHIGYCCGLQKSCPYRDTVLGIFRVTAEEYIDAKNKCQKEILKGKIE